MNEKTEYKKLVKDAKKEMDEKEQENFEETVKKTAKDLMLKIKKAEDKIDEFANKLNELKKQLVDLETGNVEYDAKGKVSAIVIENKKTGKKTRITPDGKITDGLCISDAISSDSTGVYVTMG